MPINSEKEAATADSDLTATIAALLPVAVVAATVSNQTLL